MSASPFAMRGIVEGFYGPRWTDDARARMIEHAGRLGLTHHLLRRGAP